MNQIIKLKQPNLRVAHESEVLILHRELAELRAELSEMKNIMNTATIKSSDRKVVLQSNGQHHFISLSDIIYCEADGNYTKIFIQEESKSETERPELNCRLSGTEVSRSTRTERSPSLLISKTLKYVIELIASVDFIRCHQSYLINKNHVIGYESRKGLYLKLSNKKSIPVSRRNKMAAMDWLKFACKAESS